MAPNTSRQNVILHMYPKSSFQLQRSNKTTRSNPMQPTIINDGKQVTSKFTTLLDKAYSYHN